jgi:hypothetical protein
MNDIGIRAGQGRAHSSCAVPLLHQVDDSGTPRAAPGGLALIAVDCRVQSCRTSMHAELKAWATFPRLRHWEVWGPSVLGRSINSHQSLVEIRRSPRRGRSGPRKRILASFGLRVTARLAPCSRSLGTRRPAVHPSHVEAVQGRRHGHTRAPSSAMPLLHVVNDSGAPRVAVETVSAERGRQIFDASGRRGRPGC